VIREESHVAGENDFALFVQYVCRSHPLRDDGAPRID
jgi:hypothetical protein